MCDKKLKLPIDEEELLKGLDEYTAHADEIVAPSPTEQGSVWLIDDSS